MKPQGWDEFLKHLAREYGVQGKLKEIFLVRFAYENWRKPDEGIWEWPRLPAMKPIKNR